MSNKCSNKEVKKAQAIFYSAVKQKIVKETIVNFPTVTQTYAGRKDQKNGKT